MNAIPALPQQLDDVRVGSLTVVHPDGTTTHYGNGDPGPKIIFHSGNIFDLLGDDPFLSFGEAYMDGQVEVEGDLANLASFAIRNGLASAKNAAQGGCICDPRQRVSGRESLRCIRFFFHAVNHETFL
ncbi:MAG TPA: hypothetical protein VKO18_11615 [Terriglobia bacterium]|nr:hypothetical protein [Candidatus Acidoferrum sp.]HMD85331.1 hypothetical protein [Terriglobia bacterium]